MELTSTEHTIIHTAAVAAAATAASPIPFSDAALLIPIQATMITGLYKANGANISQGFVKGVLKATMISTFGKSLAGNLLKFIPVVGTLAGGTINAGVAVGFTEALGFAVVGELRGTDNADLIDLANVTKDVLEGFTKK
ncbi:GTPase [Ligilactobacillus ruminis]|uniref:GTPase n=1 Tax=Ligilactobacillus ruminis TaxID=1623 RepID=UPI003D01E2AA